MNGHVIGYNITNIKPAGLAGIEALTMVFKQVTVGYHGNSMGIPSDMSLRLVAEAVANRYPIFGHTQIRTLLSTMVVSDTPANGDFR